MEAFILGLDQPVIPHRWNWIAGFLLATVKQTAKVQLILSIWVSRIASSESSPNRLIRPAFDRLPSSGKFQ